MKHKKIIEIGLNQEEIKRQYEKEVSIKKLNDAGGYAPTLRDELGNVLLYEDLIVPGQQLASPSQWITIDLLRPNFDESQIDEIIDTDIVELFKVSTSSEVERLRNELEDLRKDLKNSTAPIEIIHAHGDEGDDEGDEGGGTPGAPGDNDVSIDDRFPTTALTLADKPGGELSDSIVRFGVDSAIFNDSTYNLESFGGANPFAINWWIIDHITTEIYLSGKNDTLFEINVNNLIVDDGKEIDAVIELVNTPRNFGGWFVNDQSGGKLTNFIKISNDIIVRFRVLVRRNVGSPTIDQFRNYYYMVASFVNEVPTFSDKEDIKINISVSKFFNGSITTLDEFNSIITIIETDQFGNVLQNESLTTPINITVTKGSTVKLIAKQEIMIDSADQEITIDSIVMKFEGWRLSSNGALVNATSTFEFKSNIDTNLVVSYVDPENPGQRPTDFDDNIPPKGRIP